MPAANVQTVDLDGLRAVARDLSDNLEPGSVVWLVGPIGAGKTTLVRFLVEALEGDEPSSPSFALVQEYATREGDVVHADCYRLRDPAEAFDLDLWAAASRCRLLLVEWAERGGEHVPVPSVKIKIGHADDPNMRTIEVITC